MIRTAPYVSWLGWYAKLDLATGSQPLNTLTHCVHCVLFIAFGLGKVDQHSTSNLLVQRMLPLKQLNTSIAGRSKEEVS